MSELAEVAVSKASAQQRCGRAGRVQEGVCFRLFSRPTYDCLPKYSVPEMLRVPLEELCLHIMVCIVLVREDTGRQAQQSCIQYAVATAD